MMMIMLNLHDLFGSFLYLVFLALLSLMCSNDFLVLCLLYRNIHMLDLLGYCLKMN